MQQDAMMTVATRGNTRDMHLYMVLRGTKGAARLLQKQRPHLSMIMSVVVLVDAFTNRERERIDQGPEMEQARQDECVAGSQLQTPSKQHRPARRQHSN